MAQSRYYSATAQPTVLTSGITSTQVTINVVAVTGFPASVPYILALDYNTPSEEIVLVTAQAGTTLTVTRAYDGTSGTSHNSGAGVRHTWTAKDGNDSRAHEASSTGVHGLGSLSSVVGTLETQTLSNKTLINPTITGATLNSATFNSPTINNETVTGATITGLSTSNPAITGVITGNGTYQTPTFIADVDADASAVAKRRSATQTGVLFSYQNETGTELANVGFDGVPHWKQGAQFGSSNQLQVNGSGSINTSAPITSTGAIVGATFKATDPSMLLGYVENMTYTGSISNTSYAAVPGSASVTITLPPSGKALVQWQGRIESGGNSFSLLSMRAVGSASGTIRSPSDSWAIMIGSSANVYLQNAGMAMFSVTGQPGETVTLTPMSKTTAGSYGVYSNIIAAFPLLA